MPGGDLAVGDRRTSSGPGGGRRDHLQERGAGSEHRAHWGRCRWSPEEFYDGYDAQGTNSSSALTASPAPSCSPPRPPRGSPSSPNGGTEIQNHPHGATPTHPYFPGSVEWDGTYLTVFDQLASKIYQYDVKGTKAALKGTVRLSGAGDCAHTCIVKGHCLLRDAGTDDGEAFSYPAGGSAIAVFKGNFDEPLGVVAAKK